ncbi:hypothetical protein LTS18_007981 [Coniosporium uncinatum]|uniref:Uncharacterized protein n=1 Tax=Coniosporium uncinatum TaxID=93489 RepID=A0ACC3D1Z0_9PEZI|nr:hypothetical protein LTS18_007981 [Coniosporium uncinatum]
MPDPPVPEAWERDIYEAASFDYDPPTPIARPAPVPPQPEPEGWEREIYEAEVFDMSWSALLGREGMGDGASTGGSNSTGAGAAFVTRLNGVGEVSTLSARTDGASQHRTVQPERLETRIHTAVTPSLLEGLGTVPVVTPRTGDAEARKQSERVQTQAKELEKLNEECGPERVQKKQPTKRRKSYLERDACGESASE